MFKVLETLMSIDILPILIGVITYKYDLTKIQNFVILIQKI